MVHEAQICFSEAEVPESAGLCVVYSVCVRACVCVFMCMCVPAHARVCNMHMQLQQIEQAKQ